MGVINVTPDSFSDGGKWRTVDAALGLAERMVAEGADVLDIGGESTRPGAEPVSENEEIRRVVPVIEAIRRRFHTPISIDTSKGGVMAAAVEAGAEMINDVSALRREGALSIAVALSVPVCLMHMQGDPRTMQLKPTYGDVVDEVIDFLRYRVAACEAAGLERGKLLVDPGFGFGKNLAHNLVLLRNLKEVASLGLPMVVGLSRKSIIGQLTGQPVRERLHASVGLAVYSALQGAAMVRVHDVAPTVEALRVIDAIVKEQRHG